MGLKRKATLSALDKPSQGGGPVNRHNKCRIATAVVEAELRALYRTLCTRNREEAGGCQGWRVMVGKWVTVFKRCRLAVIIMRSMVTIVNNVICAFEISKRVDLKFSHHTHICNYVG